MIKCQNKSKVSLFKKMSTYKGLLIYHFVTLGMYFSFFLSFLSQLINTQISFNACSKHHFSKKCIFVFVLFLLISSLLVHFVRLTHIIFCRILPNPLEECLCLPQFCVTCGIKYRPYLHKYLQFSSVAQSCPTLCDPMNRSTPGLPTNHQLPEFTQTHVHRVSDAIQPSHPLASPSPPAPNPSQHQSLFH